MAVLEEFALQPEEVQTLFRATYGDSAPYFWGAESGRLQVSPQAQAFYAQPRDVQATFYGVFGEEAAERWAAENAAAGAGAPPGAPLTTTAPGAGAAAAAPQARPTGWSPMTPSGLTGFLDFGKRAINLIPDYIPALNDPKLAPGYLPSSGSYNQFPLNEKGLFGTVPGTTGTVNLRYGLGGTGDPTTGGEVQTPDRWVLGTGATTPMQGDAKWRATGGTWRGGGGMGGGGWQPVDGYAGVELWQGGAGAPGPGGGGGQGGGYFGSTVASNWGQTAETAGLDPIATLFLRSDTPTGISTAAWSAPQQMWDALINEIRRGRITVQSPDAWAMLAQKNPAYTPQNIGGAALQGVQPGAATGGTATGSDNGLTNYYAQMAAVQQANQAMQQAYTEWQMATGDERLAMEKAQQVWSNTFQEAQQRFNQGVTEAGLTGQYQGAPTVTEQQRQWQNAYNQGQLLGTYQGQDTLAKQQLQQSGALALLQQQAALQGPESWARYAQLNQSTPEGLRSALAALAGNYNLAASGAQGTPGPATLESRVRDLTSGGQPGGTNLLSTSGGAAPGAGQYALTSPNQINLANYTALTPSMQKMVQGTYSAAGYDPDDFMKALQAAAPRYAGPAAGTVQL